MAETFAKYHCNYCEEDINGLRVRCLECDDFDLCLECFACGAEIGKHKGFHAYQFMDTGNFNISPGSTNWTAREEVRLLDAIEQYGFGNWEDIAAHIETKTAEEARIKYTTSYIEGSIGKHTWKPTANTFKTVPTQNVVADTGPLSPTIGSSLPATPLPQEETIALGYMVLRDDFEREWDNDAESAISSLFLHPVDDDEVDRALKLAQVDMYIRRLRERSRRKRVIRDFQLVQQFAMKEKDKSSLNPHKRKHKDDREALSDKLRPISQFMTALEYRNIINSLARERELRVRIKELLRYRRNGIRHVEECSEFEIARLRRDKRKEFKKLGSLPPTPMIPMELHQRRENDEKNPRCSVEKKCTPPDTGGGKWHNVNWHDSNSSPQNLNFHYEDKVSISSLPGYRLLSRPEKKLCASLNLKPSQYISYKAVLLKEDSDRKSKHGSLYQRKPPFGLDPVSHREVCSFLSRTGWVSSCS